MVGRNRQLAHTAPAQSFAFRLDRARLRRLGRQNGARHRLRRRDFGRKHGKKGAAQVLGSDLAEKSIKVAKLHALEAGVQNLKYETISAEELAAARPASFDVVTCMEMLEHVPDPAAIVRAASELVRPGGCVVFSTINRNAKAWLMAIVGAEYIMNLVPRGTHEYAKLIKLSELGAWCRQNGLQLQQSSGVEYQALTRRMYLSSNTDVNYMMAFEKIAPAPNGVAHG